MLFRSCAAGRQLREQIDDTYPHRDRTSDGWIGDSRHSVRPSDHNPDANGIVRAIDIDRDLGAHKEEAHAVVEKIRLCAKRGDKRIKYIIFDGKIMSPILGWTRRTYRGANPHQHHFHISFTTLGDRDGSFFNLEGANNERTQTDGGIVGEDIPRDGSINLPCGGTGCKCNCHSRSSVSLA